MELQYRGLTLKDGDRLTLCRDYFDAEPFEATLRFGVGDFDSGVYQYYGWYLDGTDEIVSLPNFEGTVSKCTT